MHVRRTQSYLKGDMFKCSFRFICVLFHFSDFEDQLFGFISDGFSHKLSEKTVVLHASDKWCKHEINPVSKSIVQTFPQWYLVQASLSCLSSFQSKSFVWYGRRCVVKQINILPPCVDDSQRRYTSEVQLQYDEPLYNQVVGRLIMDGIYAPINSKIYRTTAK